MESIDPEGLIWGTTREQGEITLHCFMFAHVPGHNNMLVYEALCGVKGMIRIAPVRSELKCEVCEHRHKQFKISEGE